MVVLVSAVVARQSPTCSGSRSFYIFYFMESIAASLLEGIRPLLVHAEAEGKPANFQTRLIRLISPDQG